MLELDQYSMWPRVGLLCFLIAVATPCRAETDAVNAWRKQIVVRLNASKRFPREAMGQSGTAKVGFVLDRAGKLISSKLLESSGVKELDLEAVAIVERAQPFPAPPPEIDDDGLELAVPLIFQKGPKISTQSSQFPAPDFSKENTVVDTKLRSICRGC